MLKQLLIFVLLEIIMFNRLYEYKRVARKINHVSCAVIATKYYSERPYKGEREGFTYYLVYGEVKTRIEPYMVESPDRMNCSYLGSEPKYLYAGHIETDETGAIIYLLIFLFTSFVICVMVF